MMKSKRNIITVLSITAILLYLFGYNIAHLFYNSTGLTGIEKKEVIRHFWELRFSLYSVIIALVFFSGRYFAVGVNRLIFQIGFDLAMISAIDKMILKTYSFEKYDTIIIITVIVWEIIMYKKRK